MPFLVFNVLPFFKSRMKTDFVPINILLIAWLNIAVAVLSPNGRISHSNRPKVVAKASFSVCLGWISMCQYPRAKSRVEKIFAFAIYPKVCQFGVKVLRQF